MNARAERGESSRDSLGQAASPVSFDEPDMERRSDFQTLLKGATFRGLSQGVALFLGLVSSVLLLRSLGIRGFGTLQFALSIVTFTGAVSDLGVGLGVTRMSSHDPAADVDWGRAGLRITLFTGLAATVALLIVALLLPSRVATTITVLAPLILAAALSSPLRGFLAARRRIALVEGTRVLPQVLAHGSAILLSALGVATVLRVATAAVLPRVLVMILLLLIWHELSRKVRRGRTLPVRRLLVFSLPLLLQSVSSQALIRSDVIMLGLFAGPASVGLYAPTLRLADLTWMALLVIGSYYVPVATRIVAGGDFQRLQELYVTLTKWEIALIGPLLAVLIVTPVPILTFLFGAPFEHAAGFLRILALGYAAAVVSGYNGFTLVALGKSRAVGVRSLIAAVGNLALNAVLIPALGPLGAALGTAAASVGINVANSYLLYKAAGAHIFRVEILLVLGSSTVAASSAGLLAAGLGWSGSLRGSFLVGGAVALAGIGAATLTGKTRDGGVLRRLFSPRSELDGRAK